VDIASAAAYHDELLAHMPEGARHDGDICPFCVEKAMQDRDSTASVPSSSELSGAPTDQPPLMEGGNTRMTDDSKMISSDTHEALLEKALRDATSVTESALERKTEEAAEAAAKVETLTTELETLKADNAELNRKLDEAQLQLKAANDKAEQLEAEKNKAIEDAAKAELASSRADQVKRLSLFSEEYISEKASAWADLAEDAWNDRLTEWQAIKPATVDGTPADTASAMSGSTEGLTSEPQDEASAHKPNSRRAVLGLTS
jgi:hypothetical protein